MKEKPLSLNPSITFDCDMMKHLALKHASKLEFFKDEALTVRAELNYNDQLTGGMIVSTYEHEDAE